jgi:hypothetical protein
MSDDDDRKSKRRSLKGVAKGLIAGARLAAGPKFLQKNHEKGTPLPLARAPAKGDTCSMATCATEARHTHTPVCHMSPFHRTANPRLLTLLKSSTYPSYLYTLSIAEEAAKARMGALRRASQASKGNGQRDSVTTTGSVHEYVGRARGEGERNVGGSAGKARR